MTKSAKETMAEQGLYPNSAFTQLDVPLARVRKPETFLDLGPVDIVPLLRLVETMSPTLWSKQDEIKENKFDCFHHTQHMIFRFITGNRDARRFVSHPAWLLWKPVLQPIMEQAVIPYGFAKPVFPKAMLAKLRAGHGIDLHTDGAGANLYTHKIHVPLVTDERVSFLLREESFHLQAGRAYEVNNIARHGGRNDSDIDRVHFIFEVMEGRAADTNRDVKAGRRHDV